ncbi:MAG: hypothetical protein N4A45_02710 [Flavobacteriales bacterium]|jgi:hypothetical protein|nr:hypothetical protein [Flavobacteriales bacterium]
MKRKILATSLIAISAIGLSKAQVENDNQLNATDSTEQTVVLENKNAILLTAGTTGIGVQYARKINKNIHLVLTGSMITIPEQILGSDVLDTDEVEGRLEANSQNIGLIAEYYPFKGGFHLAAGVTYYLKNEISAGLNIKKAIEFGDVELNPNDFGKADITIDWSGIAPYLGLGFGHSVVDNMINVSFEGGCYFLNAPQVDLVATERFRPMTEEGKDIEKALETWKYYPNLQLRISYNF